MWYALFIYWLLFSGSLTVSLILYNILVYYDTKREYLQINRLVSLFSFLVFSIIGIIFIET